MEVVIDGVLVSTANCGARKRQRTGGKRTEAKKKRYSAPSGNNVYVPCKHSSKALRDRLYKVADKQRQDTIIASLVITKNVTLRRPNNPNQNKSESSGSQHAFSASYFITSSSGRRISMCKNYFIAITKIGRTRLANIVTKVYAGEPIEKEEEIEKAT
ncbi:hypothetical protein AVEN_181639-1 [Araneus ventricosus]|uniref:Uncharacterized protein n=1 Tax=Araneus ventricosus TaxID=182803 RepID=A0A4Y2CLH9_ARAVE|nr:hypothetical protein AVEN_181639-1 [Araneus ventricosus]